MPSNIADVSTFTSPIQVPADGDAANAASVSTGFQGLANRTTYLRNMVDQGGTGAFRPFREAAGTAAMQNITGQQDGDYVVCTSMPGQLPYGIYRFYSAFVASNGFFEIPSLTASGTWVMVGVGWALINSPNGIATLNGVGKIVEPVPNRLFGEWYASWSSYTLTSSLGPTLGGDISIPELIVGDVVIGHISYAYTYGSGGGFPSVISGSVVTSQNAGTGYDRCPTSTRLSASGAGRVASHFREQITAGGTYKASMSGFSITGGSTDSTVSNLLLTLTVLRP